MEWRCEWCGKPHDENDPPCDACGNHRFERAVERVSTDEVTGGHVWVCTDCGRQHQRNSPPCRRCGEHELERRDLASVDDPLESIGTRWRDVLEPRYVAGYVAVALLLLVLGLGVAGVYELPGTSSGPPPIEDVPGNDSTAGGHSLATVEREFVAAVGDAGSDAIGGDNAGSDSLDAVATDVNQRVVAASFGERDQPDVRAVARSHDLPCEQDLRLAPFRVTYASNDSGSIRSFDSEQALATDLHEFWLKNGGGLADADVDRVGVDVHVVGDQRVFVTVAACRVGA